MQCFHKQQAGLRLGILAEGVAWPQLLEMGFSQLARALLCRSSGPEVPDGARVGVGLARCTRVLRGDPLVPLVLPAVPLRAEGQFPRQPSWLAASPAKAEPGTGSESGAAGLSSASTRSIFSWPEQGGLLGLTALCSHQLEGEKMGRAHLGGVSVSVSSWVSQGPRRAGHTRTQCCFLFVKAPCKKPSLTPKFDGP